jgi:GNAT superfamily N-acetyltransferase
MDWLWYKRKLEISRFLVVNTKINDFKEVGIMKQVLINGKQYEFIKAFKENKVVRKSYNELTQRTYGFDFEQWYQAGYWCDTYIPYSLAHGGKIVANVSISIINYSVLGQYKAFAQIGTVMTDPEYRKQGLARYLIEKVIEEWKDKCDMMYLFANDSVLNFYPKFGFTAIREFQYSKVIVNDNDAARAEKMDMSLQCNREVLVRKVKSSVPMSKLAMLRNVGLIMFYCTSFMSHNVFYLRELDTIAVAEFSEDTLYLQDIFSAVEVELDLVIRSLSKRDIKKVVLGFAPENIDGYSVNLINEEDTTLFMLQDKSELFHNNKLRFPVLSHA